MLPKVGEKKAKTQEAGPLSFELAHLKSSEQQTRAKGRGPLQQKGRSFSGRACLSNRGAAIDDYPAFALYNSPPVSFSRCKNRRQIKGSSCNVCGKRVLYSELSEKYSIIIANRRSRPVSITTEETLRVILTITIIVLNIGLIFLLLLFDCAWDLFI